MKTKKLIFLMMIFTMSGLAISSGEGERQITPVAPGSLHALKDFGVQQNQPFRISTADGGQNIPDVIYGRDDQFLVIWNDFTNAEVDENGRTYFDIAGAIVSSEYGVVSTPFLISNQYRSLGTYNRAAAAFNEYDGEFLVCWMDQSHLFGQRLSADGFLLDGNFIIDSCSSGAITVSFNPFESNYLITYPVRGEGLHGTIITADGQGVEASFIISGEGSTQQVAFNANLNEFMVVYSVGSTSIRMRAVRPSGKLAREILVCDEIFMQNCPTIAYNAYLREYLVVWYDERHWEDYCSEFYAKRIGQNGQANSEAYLLVGGVCNLLHAPHVVYDPNNCSYILTWARQYDYVNFEFEILVQRLNCVGEIAGNVLNLRKGHIRHQNCARIALNPDSNRFLAVFEQSMGLFDDGADICGQFLATASHILHGAGDEPRHLIENK